VLRAQQVMPQEHVDAIGEGFAHGMAPQLAHEPTGRIRLEQHAIGVLPRDGVGLSIAGMRASAKEGRFRLVVATAL
jgi:hypothetical protein